MLAVICDYCGNAAERVTGREIYPNRPDLYHKVVFRCVPCDARVGTHDKTKAPLGRLANPELRRLKMRAHAAFDPKWKSGSMSRDDAYKWLAINLGISADKCHIGMFDEAMCNRVIEACGGEA